MGRRTKIETRKTSLRKETIRNLDVRRGLSEDELAQVAGGIHKWSTECTTSIMHG